MTIASEITRINTNISNAYTACNNKGATMPATQNSANLATCVSSIPTATEPTLASLTVTPSTTAQTITPPSGTDGYNTVNVSAVTASIDNNITAGNIKDGVSILGVTGTYEGSGGGSSTTYSYPELKGGNYYVLDDETVVPIYFDSCSMAGVNTSGTLVEIDNSVAIINYSGQWSGKSPITANGAVTNGSINAHVKHISLNGFPSSNYSVTFPNGTFNQAAGIVNYLTSVCISSMKNIGLQMAFKGCSLLSEVDVSSIDYLPSRAFYGSNAYGGAFSNTAVQTLSFNSLNSNSFGAYTDQFTRMLKYQTGCTVHFPSNLQSVIGSWSSVTSGFGGTNTTVLFDLPATT